LPERLPRPERRSLPERRSSMLMSISTAPGSSPRPNAEATATRG
jgi:hypothetical protein